MPKVYTGPYARCKCCNKPTPIRLASVAGPVLAQEVQITHDLINMVFRDVATALSGEARTRKVRDATNPLGVRQSYTLYRLGCRQCYLKTRILYWVEVTPNNWAGGWCKFCLHNRFEDGTFGHPEEGGDQSMNLITLSAGIKTANLITMWNDENRKLGSDKKAVISAASEVECLF